MVTQGPSGVIDDDFEGEELPRQSWVGSPRELSVLAVMEGVDPASVMPLLATCPMIEVPEGTVVISPDQKRRTLYLLLQGRLEVFLDEACAIPVASLETGEAVGEVSMIQARPAIAYVVTAAPSRLLAINERTFWRLVKASHAFSINLLTLLAQRMRTNNRQLSESVQRSRDLEREANTDALTGLLNRRWLEQSLPRFLARHSHAARPLSLLMLDIDHFKRFNDEHGHALGDAVLTLVAQTIWRCVRPSDLAARYGGEELVVVLPDTPHEGAQAAAERLRQAIAKAELPILNRAVTVSIGVASLRAGDSPADLLRRADELLYLAKERGRNRVEA